MCSWELIAQGRDPTPSVNRDELLAFSNLLFATVAHALEGLAIERSLFDF